VSLKQLLIRLNLDANTANHDSTDLYFYHTLSVCLSVCLLEMLQVVFPHNLDYKHYGSEKSLWEVICHTATAWPHVERSDCERQRLYWYNVNTYMHSPVTNNVHYHCWKGVHCLSAVLLHIFCCDNVCRKVELCAGM